MKENNSIDIRRNSLNTIRLIAAFSVMFSHACGHLQVNRPIVITQFLEYFYGVPIFFALSGYLLWHSVGKSPTFIHYAKKRFWRIFPELWIGIALELLMIVLLYDQPIHWIMFAAFAVTQGTCLQFWTPDFLRQYGVGTPNGSLWTICVLIQFYILVYFFKKIMSGKKLSVWISVLLSSFLVAILSPMAERFFSTIVYKLYNQTIFPYMWLFLTGAFISEYQGKILPFLKRYWLGLLLLSVGMMIAGVDLICGPYGYGLLRCTTLILAVIGMAYRFPKLDVKLDISYGIYIYHMTVVNALIALGFTGKPIAVCITLVLSCILAYISTISIGKFSAKKKYRINR